MGFTGSRVSDVQQLSGRTMMAESMSTPSLTLSLCHRWEQDSSCHSIGCRQPPSSKAPAPPTGIILSSNGNFKYTVPHNTSNVAIFCLAPWYSHYQPFYTTAGLEGEDLLPQCYSIWVDHEPALCDLAKEQKK